MVQIQKYWLRASVEEAILLNFRMPYKLRIEIILLFNNNNNFYINK